MQDPRQPNHSRPFDPTYQNDRPFTSTYPGRTLDNPTEHFDSTVQALYALSRASHDAHSRERAVEHLQTLLSHLEENGDPPILTQRPDGSITTERRKRVRADS